MEQNIHDNNYLSLCLKNLLKSSDMRFAAKQACSCFALKAELVLNIFFKQRDVCNLQSRNI